MIYLTRQTLQSAVQSHAAFLVASASLLLLREQLAPSSGAGPPRKLAGPLPFGLCLDRRWMMLPRLDPP